MAGSSERRLQQLLAAATVEDPSIEPERALPLLRTCLMIAADDPAADAAEIARRCVVEHPDADASWITHLARAASAADPRLATGD